MRTNWSMALTGPAAAALYQLDGFRDIVWPSLWCSPYGSRPEQGMLRTRAVIEPAFIADTLVLPVGQVMRHLNARPELLTNQLDKLSPNDRVELALEHVLRLGESVAAAQGGSNPGDAMLRQILRIRGLEPPTESYSETRTAQFVRSLGYPCWRQIPILVNGRIVFRADFMIAFKRRKRPKIFTPADGMLLETDGKEFHEPQFERDHRRGSTYDALGFHWASFTANQIEHERNAVEQAIRGALRRTGHEPTKNSKNSKNSFQIGEIWAEIVIPPVHSHWHEHCDLPRFLPSALSSFSK